MSTVIPNPADYIFKDEPESPKTTAPEIDMDTYDWSTFTIGGVSVVDKIVETLSALISKSGDAFRKDGEISLTYNDLFEVIDRMEFDEEKDHNGAAEFFVDSMGYTYKQYCIEEALDKFMEAGWCVDVDYTKFIKKEELTNTTTTFLGILRNDPLLKEIFFSDDSIDVEDAIWIAANEIESAKTVITLSPEDIDDEFEDDNEEEDDDTETPETHTDTPTTKEDSHEVKTDILKELFDEFKALLG